MKKAEFIKKFSKIEDTLEDEFRAEFNSPELIWEALKKQLTLTDVVSSVYVVTETDNYGRQLFREVFLDKEQAKEYLAIDNLKEDNINEINEIEFD